MVDCLLLLNFNLETEYKIKPTKIIIAPINSLELNFSPKTIKFVTDANIGSNEKIKAKKILPINF